MDVDIPRRDQDSLDPIRNPYALWVRDALKVAYDQVRRHSGQAVQRQKRLYDKQAVRRLFAVGSVVDVSSGAHDSVVTFFPQEVLLADTTISLHPFFMHRLDVGPISLTTIAHAFNYRVTVWRDGIKSAERVGRSRRAAERILEDIGLPWGHQVAVMFQIVSALALEVPSVPLDIESLHGMLFCPANHGDIWTIAVEVVSASIQIARALMFTTYRW